MKHKTRFLSIVSVFLLVVLFASGTRVFAQPANNPVFATIEQVQELINNALSPIQAAVQSLGSRVSGVEAVNETQTTQLTGLINHDTRTDDGIRAMSSRISSTESSIRLLENTVNDGHLQVSLTNESYPNGFGAWLPKVRVNTSWRGVFIGDAQYHGIFSVGGSDYPVVGSSTIVAPSITIPFSTLSGELDLYVFWQGMSQHVSTTLNAP